MTMKTTRESSTQWISTAIGGAVSLFHAHKLAWMDPLVRHLDDLELIDQLHARLFDGE
jgi:hypothetical protein